MTHLRKIAAIGVLAVGLAASATAYADHALHPAAAETPRTLSVAVGAESPDMALQVNAFFPRVIDANPSDTITWRVDSTEFHTITFLSGATPERFEVPTPDGLGMMVSPMAAFPIGGASYDGSGIASSGVLNKDQTFSLTFTQPGTYEYVCLVHPEMRSEVHVAGANEHAATPHQREISAEEIVVNSGLPHHAPEAPRGAPANVVAGEGTADVSLMRFLPGDVEIRVGETVTFANHDLGQMPHTVSFRSGRTSPDAIVPVPWPAGPPLLVFNPEVVEPRGAANAFDGSEFLNSGILMEAAGQPFSVTFTQPGIYEYVCLFHENMGMRGTISVLP